jgi:hypothetical protein
VWLALSFSASLAPDTSGACSLSLLSFFSRLLTVTLGVTPLYTDRNNQFIQGHAKDNRAAAPLRERSSTQRTLNGTADVDANLETASIELKVL